MKDTSEPTPPQMRLRSKVGTESAEDRITNHEQVRKQKLLGELKPEPELKSYKS